MASSVVSQGRDTLNLMIITILTVHCLTCYERIVVPLTSSASDQTKTTERLPNITNMPNHNVSYIFASSEIPPSNAMVAPFTKALPTW